MSKIRCSTLTLTSAAMLATGLLACPPAAHADNTSNLEFINRMDGSRLALVNDGTTEGTPAVTLRAPGWQFKTAKWSITVAPDGTRIFRNDAANRCLQPATAAPKAGDGLVVKTCDNSALQNWTARAEQIDSGWHTGWYTYRPQTDPALALTIAIYQGSGSWDTLYLDRDQNSTDRLWRGLKDGATW